MSADRDAIVKLLREGKRFALFLHVRPDGDSIGSTLALATGLTRMGKEAVPVRPDRIPGNLAFLPESDRFTWWEDVQGSFDAAVFIDCGDIERIGPARPLLERVRTTVNIDHHKSNGHYGDLNWIETGAAAAGELIYELLELLRVPLDPVIATALYTAIVTDTGSFGYSNTTARTHRIAARLLECGVQPAVVSRSVWENRTLASLRLLQRVLATLQTDADGRIAWVEADRAMFAAAGADPWESEGLVNYPRTVRGVEVALLFLEEEEGRVKVSLRSNQWLDVSRVAARLGGGGHARAAGCVLSGSIAEVREKVLAEVRRAVEVEGAKVPWTASSPS